MVRVALGFVMRLLAYPNKEKKNIQKHNVHGNQFVGLFALFFYWPDDGMNEFFLLLLLPTMKRVALRYSN